MISSGSGRHWRARCGSVFLLMKRSVSARPTGPCSPPPPSCLGETGVSKSLVVEALPRQSSLSSLSQTRGAVDGRSVRYRSGGKVQHGRLPLQIRPCLSPGPRIDLGVVVCVKPSRCLFSSLLLDAWIMPFPCLEFSSMICCLLACRRLRLPSYLMRNSNDSSSSPSASYMFHGRLYPSACCGV